MEGRGICLALDPRTRLAPEVYHQWGRLKHASPDRGQQHEATLGHGPHPTVLSEEVCTTGVRVSATQAQQMSTVDSIGQAVQDGLRGSRDVGRHLREIPPLRVKSSSVHTVCIHY